MLGKRLKEKRGKRTQEEIAKLLQISRARYSHYENEHVQPDNAMLQKMADLYATSVDYLLGRTDDHSMKENNFKKEDNLNDNNTDVFSEQRKKMIEAVKGMSEEQAKALYEITKHLMK